MIDNCRFINNNAYAGGAISATNKINLIVKDSYFEDNYAWGIGSDGYTSGAGAILIINSVGDNKITGSTFKNNKAVDGAGPSGGAIAIEGSAADVDKCEFYGNTASRLGGALYALDDAKIAVSNSKFDGNTAKNGSAIYNEGALTVSNNTFGENDKIESETDVAKDGSKVTIDPIANVTYGNPVVINIIIENRTNNVTVSAARMDEQGMQPDIENLNYTIEGNVVTIYGLDAGEYKVQIANIGDNNYETDAAIELFNVTKATPTFDANFVVDEFGEIFVTATVNEDATLFVSFKVDDGSDYEKIKDGVAKYRFKLYDKDTHNLTVIYEGDDNYLEASKNLTVTLTKEVPVIEIINVAVDEYGAIDVKANITKGTSGNVTLSIRNTETNKTITVPIAIGENGTIEYDGFETFEKGFYDVGINYDGNDKYYAAYAFTWTEINKTAPVLSIAIDTLENNITVNVTADNATVNGKVNITLLDKDGKAVANATEDMVNGSALYKFTDIAIGDYKVVAILLGSDDFYQDSVEAPAHVRATVDMNLTVTVNNYGQIVSDVNLTEGATGTVNFIIRNATGAVIANLTAIINNSTATDSTTNLLAKGIYTVEAIYSGDDKYGGISAVGDNATIAKEYLNVTSKVSIMDGANQATIIFTFSGNATGNATAFFLMPGTNDTFTIQNGTVVIDYVCDNGDQSVLLTYEGDDNYYGFYDVYADFFVKTSSFIVVKDVSVVYQNTAKVTVTLTDNDDMKGDNPIVGAEVVITLNGKTYKGKTNAKGVAVISIPAKLVPKKYTAKVSYKGTNVTVGETETFKFTVKKAKAKIAAKKKTFKKSKKVKKYTITLKDNKGKAIKKASVSIKVGKKTFKAKTNAKGKAVFKLKKLTKKAKYNAKVTFKGNKYFNKVTKKVKIIIK